MIDLINSLKGIIDREKALYEDIYELELKKSDAVIKRDGSFIEKICTSQELIVSEVAKLESAREKELKKKSSSLGMLHQTESLTLKQIADNYKGKSGAKLIKSGTELKTLLIKLRTLQKHNEKIIKDNMEYFEIMLSGIKNSSSIKSGYGCDGKEESRVANPILFNQTA